MVRASFGAGPGSCRRVTSTSSRTREATDATRTRTRRRAATDARASTSPRIRAWRSRSRRRSRRATPPWRARPKRHLYGLGARFAERASVAEAPEAAKARRAGPRASPPTRRTRPGGGAEARRSRASQKSTATDRLFRRRDVPLFRTETKTRPAPRTRWKATPSRRLLSWRSSAPLPGRWPTYARCAISRTRLTVAQTTGRSRRSRRRVCLKSSRRSPPTETRPRARAFSSSKPCCACTGARWLRSRGKPPRRRPRDWRNRHPPSRRETTRWRWRLWLRNRWKRLSAKSCAARAKRAITWT